jgi:hypothetical protein
MPPARRSLTSVRGAGIRGIVAAAVLAGLAAPAAQAEAPTPPTCSDPAPLTVRTDSPSSLSVYATCGDADDSPMTMVVDTSPAHGSFTLNSTSPWVGYYQPASGFSGEDAIAYHVHTSGGDSNTVVQHVTVDPGYNQPPSCQDASSTVRSGRTVQITPACFDQDGDKVAASVATAPDHGTATPNDTGGVAYRAADGYVGADALELVVDDGHGGTAGVHVSITVTDQDQAPTCQTLYTVARAGKTDPFNPYGSCSDPDDDPIGYTLVTQPPHASVARRDDGVWQIATEQAAAGPLQFTMRADDGVQHTDFTVQVITVASLDTMPECENRAVSVPGGETTPIQLSCFDRDLDVPHLEVAAPPAHAALGAIDQGPQTIPFTPEPGFSGVTTLGYRAVDGVLGPSPAAVVTVTVLPSPDRSAPRLGLAPAARQRLGAVLSGGVAMAVRTDEPAKLSVRALLPASAARKLGLARHANRPVEVGRATRQVKAGRTALRVRLTPKARRALRRARTATLRLRATATDAAGNQRTLSSRVTLRRGR